MHCFQECVLLTDLMIWVHLFSVYCLEIKQQIKKHSTKNARQKWPKFQLHPVEQAKTTAAFVTQVRSHVPGVPGLVPPCRPDALETRSQHLFNDFHLEKI